MACSKMNTKFENILKCAICQEKVKKPQTLTCFHTFCEDCINEITVREEQEVNGIQCPVCRSITPKEYVSSNSLVNELLEMHSSDKNGHATCETCSKGEPKWRCLDCKVELCEDCKQVHSKLPLLRSHKVVDRNSEPERVIDRMVFCRVHHDQQVMFNCKECEIPLCIKCKMTEHENHKTETIEKCLERILPKLGEQKTKTCDVVKGLDENVNILTSSKEELRAAFVKCRDQAKINLNAVIEKVRSQHSQLVKQLDMKEEEELTKLEVTQDELEGKRKELKHVVEWVDTSLEMAKGVTLMSEVQSGLLNKVKSLAEFKIKQNLSLEFPSLQSATLEENYIGKPTFKPQIILKTTNKARITYPDTFSNLKCVDTIKLSKPCTRMGLVNGEIWCPLGGTNVIEVINFSGVKANDITIPNQSVRTVQQAVNGDIFLANDTGVNIINEDGSVHSKLVKGNFSDISTDGDTMVALDYGSSVVYVFKCENDKWKQDSMMKTTKTHKNQKYTILFSYHERCIYISDSSSITVYNMNGSQIRIYENLAWPYLCEADNSGCVLLADLNHYNLKKIKDGVTTQVFGMNAPYSCVCIDVNDIWILHDHWLTGYNVEHYVE